MTACPVTYLTTDSLQEGVGASQVLAYAEGLAARGIDLRLHTFEKRPPGQDLLQRLDERSIRWAPHHFGRHGAIGGLARVLAGARAVRGANLVHARSDLAAASVLVSRARRWVWDVRSLWADQRIALGSLQAGGAEDLVLRDIERRAAASSSAIVTLTQAVIPVLQERHGDAIASKCTVIPTCVDLARFPLHPMPAAPPLRLLLAGTLNSYYDVPAMLALVAAGRRRGRAHLDVLAPEVTGWEHALAEVEAQRTSATPARMPQWLRGSHIGLSVCRSDAGVSLTAAMPTKIAEFLATGRPVVVNAGLGDADQLIEEAAVGVVLRDSTPSGLDDAWDQLELLVADPSTPARCRALAEAHFDLDRAVDSLASIYDRVGQSR